MWVGGGCPLHPDLYLYVSGPGPGYGPVLTYVDGCQQQAPRDPS